jgi:hypothetical protein
LFLRSTPLTLWKTILPQQRSLPEKEKETEKEGATHKNKPRKRKNKQQLSSNTVSFNPSPHEALTIPFSSFILPSF